MTARNIPVDQADPSPSDRRAARTVNRAGSLLLVATAVFLAGFGLERIVYWALLPLGPQFGAGEAFGIAVGVFVLLLAALVGWAARGVWRDARGAWIAGGLWGAGLVFLAYIAMSTPGPAPVPVPLSIAAALVGVALVGLALGRTIRRSPPPRDLP